MPVLINPTLALTPAVVDEAGGVRKLTYRSLQEVSAPGVLSLQEENRFIKAFWRGKNEPFIS